MKLDAKKWANNSTVKLHHDCFWRPSLQTRHDLRQDFRFVTRNKDCHVAEDKITFDNFSLGNVPQSEHCWDTFSSVTSIWPFSKGCLEKMPLITKNWLKTRAEPKCMQTVATAISYWELVTCSCLHATVISTIPKRDNFKQLNDKKFELNQCQTSRTRSMISFCLDWAFLAVSRIISLVCFSFNFFTHRWPATILQTSIGKNDLFEVCKQGRLGYL